MIVGAGPTGLVLALLLARMGVQCRLIDRADRPGTASRALVIHARTLELYRRLGIADQIVAAGVELKQFRLREGQKDVARLIFANIGAGLSPYPTLLSLAQDSHEALLQTEFERTGGLVERGARLETLVQDKDGVTATLSTGPATETARFAYVVGADGASSTTRHAIDIGFPGGTYSQRFFVADVEIPGIVEAEGYLTLGSTAFVLMLPARRNGTQRLVGVVPDEFGDCKDLSFEQLRPGIRALIGLDPAQVNWFSTYHVHHRVADRFRAGRVFLAGDAGHVHSPAGGQGMNTGIGDAFNLGWKLAHVVSGRAKPDLLDSYEPERIAFARTLVATTDAAFTRIVDPGIAGHILRSVLIPRLLPAITGMAATRRALFLAISQLHIAYPDSVLSEGRAGKLRGGDRLPWIAGNGATNFDLAPKLGWQVHVTGAVDAGFASDCDELGVAVHRIAWTDAAKAAGFVEGGAYLVRPDGCLGLVMQAQDGRALGGYVRARGLRFGAA